MRKLVSTLLLVAALVMPALVFSRSVTLINNMSVTVWAAAQGNPLPSPNAWKLAPGARVTITVSDTWQAARIWGRTGCNDATGTCETGDCGNKFSCDGAGGIPPATLSEWTFAGWGGLDYYDVSLVDGYNVPMVLKNVGGTKSGNGTKYDCGVAGCTADLNATCPAELQMKNSAGKVVACYSACMKFNTDQYCCRNAYGTPATCPPTSYSQAFKAACPDAYSYAYDDDSSTYTCIGGNYEVIFGTTSTSSTSTTSTSSTSTSSTSSGAATTIQSGSLYEIVNVNSGKAWDVAWASTADGAAVQQCTRYYNSAQTWRIDDMGNGLKFTAQCSGKVLDVPGANAVNNAKLQQWTDNGTTAQRWGAGLYGSAWKFFTVINAKCIDVPGASTADGAQLQLWDDNGNNAQRFYLYKK